MGNFKGFIAILLSAFLVSLTACGTKSSGAEIQENIVEVDYGNLSYSDFVSGSVESQMQSSSSSYSEIASKESKSEEIDQDDFSNSRTGLTANLTWFDDCVFMGDSLTLGLSYYNDMTGALGNAKFVCSAGLGWCNSQWDLYDENEVHPLYNGEKVLLEDAVALTGSKKAIIGLGMNDIGIYGIEETLRNAKDFIDTLRGKSPDVQIYLETITPMIQTAEYDTLNNQIIINYNNQLEIFAREQNCRLINSWEALSDENGALPVELCQDPDDLGIHLTNEGCEIWTDCILHSVY